MSSTAQGANDGGGGEEHGVKGRAHTQEVGGDGRVGHARSVPRVAPTWMSCLTTQLEQERRRKSACERGCGNGLRASQGAGESWRLRAAEFDRGIKKLILAGRCRGGRVQAAAGLGSSLLDLGKFVQLQPTCISACAHRPAGACASAALQRDDSADLQSLIHPRSHPAIY